MPALIMDTAVFLHAPKAAGTWCSSALRRMGAVEATLMDPDGLPHPTLEQVRRVTGKPVIVTVRHPVGWLRSFWRFFQARAWRPGASGAGVPCLEPLMALASPSFAEFAQRYLDRRPGYVSELFRARVDGERVIVARMEDLPLSLESALAEAGQKYTDPPLRLPPENVSRRFDAACPAEVEAVIVEAEKWMVERWYSEVPVPAQAQESP